MRPGVGDVRHGAQDAEQGDGPEHGAHQLRADVGGGVGQPDPARDGVAHGDGGVKVAAGDVADGQHRRGQRQAGGQGGGQRVRLRNGEQRHAQAGDHDDQASPGPRRTTGPTSPGRGETSLAAGGWTPTDSGAGTSRVMVRNSFAVARSGLHCGVWPAGVVVRCGLATRRMVRQQSASGIWMLAGFGCPWPPRHDGQAHGGGGPAQERQPAAPRWTAGAPARGPARSTAQDQRRGHGRDRPARRRPRKSTGGPDRRPGTPRAPSCARSAGPPR